MTKLACKTVFAAAAAFCAAAFAASPIQWEPLCEPGGGGYYTSIAVDPFDSNHIVAGGDMLGSGVSFDGGDTWTMGFGFNTYEIATPTFHPSKKGEVWIGTCSGPYKSTDGGRHWTSKRKGMGDFSGWNYSSMVEIILIDAANPSRMIAFGGTSRRWAQCDRYGWIWLSDDAGENWRHAGTIAGDKFVSDKKKGSNIVRAFWGPGKNPAVHLVADGSGWWTSLDGGKSWKRNDPKGVAGKLTAVTIHPKNPDVVWIATHGAKGADGKWAPGGIFKSTDGGKTFAASDAGIKKSYNNGENQVSSFTDVAVSAANPDILYTSDVSWSVGIVYQSLDGGKTWRKSATRDGSDGSCKTETACFAGLAMRMVADQRDAKRAYGFNTEFILRTRDGGKTWEDSSSYRPDPSKPKNWRGRGWNGWCSMDIVFNPYKKGQSLAIAMDAARGWFSDDGLKSWRYTMGSTSDNPWMGGHSATFSKDGHIYLTTGQFGSANGIIASSDGGKTWRTLAGAKRGLPEAGWGSKGEYGDVYALPDDGRKAWVVLSGNLLSTDDGGETWKKVEGITGASHIAADPSGNGRFYVKTSGGVFGTKNGIKFFNLGLPRNEGRGRINCDAKGRILACVWRKDGNGGLWRFDPADRKWTRLLDDNLAIEANADPSDPTRILVVTSTDPYFDGARAHGVFVSADDGKSWSGENGNLAMLRANTCAFDPFDTELVVIGTYGGGFKKARWPKSYRPAGTKKYVHTDKDTENAKPLTPKPFALKVKNGNFAKGDKIVDFWEGPGVRDTKTFKTGDASLRIDGNGTAGQALEGVKGPMILHIKGRFKVSAGENAQVAVQAFSEGWGQNKWIQLKYVQGPADWTEFDGEITLPDWTHIAFLRFMAAGTGSAWLDSIEDVTSVKTENVAAFTSSEPSPSDYNDVQFKGRTDKEDAVGYKIGEPIVFLLSASDYEKVPMDVPYTVHWKRTGDDGKTLEGKGKFTFGRDFAVTTSLDRAGFVRLEAFVHGGKGDKKIERGFPKTGEEWQWTTKVHLFFDGGAGVETDKIRQGVPEPADFDEYWASQKARLAKVPVKATRREVPCSNKKVKLYQVMIDCAGPRPVTGFLSIPVAATEGKKMPAQGVFEGYGTYQQTGMWWIPEDRINLQINAHGFELGKDKSYYDAFFKSIAPGKYQYAFSPEENSNRDTAYFNGMVLRVLRTFDYLKSLPEWNGKDLWAQGGSQGGLQTMWAAGLVPEITKASPEVTWCCDLGGFKAGRLQAGWRVPYVDALCYYDAVNFAKRVPKTCAVEITRAGLGDYVCPPSGLAALYNAIPSKKSINWVQGSQHGYTPKSPNQTVKKQSGGK